MNRSTNYAYAHLRPGDLTKILLEDWVVYFMPDQIGPNLTFELLKLIR